MPCDEGDGGLVGSGGRIFMAESYLCSLLGQGLGETMGWWGPSPQLPNSVNLRMEAVHVYLSAVSQGWT